jgi:MFS family permease
MLSERYGTRKTPLILGVIVLIGSQIMLMEAPVYWLMCLARILQGVGSTITWVVGLSLLCDMTPATLIGRQLGISMTGMSIGLLLGPSLGGALYTRFDFRGPFIFGIIAAVLDLVGRLVIIERQKALRWVSDPLSHPQDQQPGSNVTQPANFTLDGADTSKENGSEQAQVQATLSLSLLSVMIQFTKSSRGMAATLLTFIFGILYTSLEPTLPLRMQSSFGFDSTKVGLVFLAAVVPSLGSGPLTGFIADRYGTSWITVVTFLSSMPWWGLMIIDNLPLFITSFGMSSLLISGALSPLMAELAAVSRKLDGVGYAHVYAAFNGAYAIGSAIGPILGGQIYDHINQGWMVLCLLAIGLLGLGLSLAFFYIGDEPVFKQLVKCMHDRGE